MSGAGQYARHRPEQTLLYQLVEKYYPEFCVQLEEQGRFLPRTVHRDFEEFLRCGRLEHGFLRVKCEACHHENLLAFSCKRRGFCGSCGARRMAETAALLVDDILPHQPMRQWVLSFPYPLRFLLASYPELMGQVLAIVYRVLSTHLTKKAGYKKKDADTGAVTLIQRFGSALNLNIHIHMIFLDGVFVENGYGKLRFKRIKAPSFEELSKLVQTISHRVAKFLERKGFLVRDAENDYISLDEGNDNEGTMATLYGHSITYRIAVGPQAGRKVFTLQTLPPIVEDDFCTERVVKQAGFSLHAGVSTEAHQRDKLEKLCRYISRPAVSEKRLSMTSTGKVRYELKTPYRDGTTHVFFEPVDFVAHLAALVPKPWKNLTRYHGIFAPNHNHRIKITPAKRGRCPGNLSKVSKSPVGEVEREAVKSKHESMTWSQRLKRVFDIDVEACERCGAKTRIIASIEDPMVIEKMLTHMRKKNPDQYGEVLCLLPKERGPPIGQVFDY